MADVEIRNAGTRDLDAIHALEVRAFPSPWRRDFFESELRGESRFHLVARRGGLLIGYLFAMWFFDEMHINKIAVTEEERRRGIAGKLMEHCFRFAKANHIRSISLEVRETNIGAQEFYKQLDFAATYKRPRYYPDGESAVVMMRVMSNE